MITRSLVSVAAIAALSLTATACGSGSGNSGSSGSGVQTITDGKLTVCTDAPYNPFDKISGTTYEGFDGEIVNAVARQMKLKVVPIDTSFDAIESGLAVKSHKCDMASSAITITDERKKNITFSAPYYDSKQSLLVPTGSPIKSIKDLKGKKVGVQKDTTGATYATKNATGAKVTAFPDDSAEYTAIQGHSVDALLQDLPVNLEHTKDGKFTVVEQYDTGEQYGFAFNKVGSEDLVKAFDDGLAAIKKDGTYDKIYNKYFKVS